MRFELSYMGPAEPSVKNKNVGLLQTLLNYHLLESFHGWTFDCLHIKFNNQTLSAPREKAKRYLDLDAALELDGHFLHNRSYSLLDMIEGFRLVKRAVQLADTIPVKSFKSY